MISHKNIYKISLIFSVLVNLMLIALTFFVINDSLANEGELMLEGKKLLFFVILMLAYTITNIVFIKKFSLTNQNLDK